MIKQRRKSRIFRALATVLAFGGVGWGLFCAIFFLRGDVGRAMWLFGPGYVVTVGYLWRALAPPPPEWRRLIWAGSILIQGAWLNWSLPELWQRGLPHYAFGYISNGWWIASFAISILGVILDVEHDPVS